MNTSIIASEDYKPVIDSPPGNEPFYQKDATAATESAKLELSAIPQGPGSRLDSDTVDGIQAVTADKAGPNKLVATGSDGLLPAAVIPAGGNTTLLSLLWADIDRG